MKTPRRQRNKFLSLYLWHRYAGLVAALFVIFISVSGIALNHTDELQLKKTYLSSPTLLDVYHVQAPTKTSHFRTAQHRISQADDLLFINSFDALTIDSNLIGAVELNELLFIGLDDRLLLINQHGQLIETISSLDGLPKNINLIGVNHQRLILLAGTTNYWLSDDFSINEAAPEDPINWSKPTPMNQRIELTIQHQYRSRIINLETLMLDMHSGRLFGAYGTLVFDLIGIILLFLAATGVIIWFKQRPKKHRS